MDMVVPCSPGNPSSLRVRAVVRNIQPSRVRKKWIKILHPDLFLRTRGTVETTRSCWAEHALPGCAVEEGRGLGGGGQGRREHFLDGAAQTKKFPIKKFSSDSQRPGYD